MREDVIERANGERGIYGVVDKDPACIIIPIDSTPDGDFVYLVEQFRYTVGERFKELPQGGWEIAQADPEEMAREIVDRDLNVRQVEALAKERGKRSGKGVSKARTKSADTIALERRLSDVLGLTVIIDHRGEGGALQIRYRSLDQLDDVVRRLEMN